jgi:hypothetical protein
MRAATTLQWCTSTVYCKRAVKKIGKDLLVMWHGQELGAGTCGIFFVPFSPSFFSTFKLVKLSIMYYYLSFPFSLKLKPLLRNLTVYT